MAFESPQDFKAVLFPPALIVFYLLAFAAPAGLLVSWIFSANAALLFVATAIGYFLNYELLHFAFDPVHERLGVSPHYLGALELQRFLDTSDYDLFDVAEVVRRNRERALANPDAPYGGITSLDDILDGRPVATPLTAPSTAASRFG